MSHNQLKFIKFIPSIVLFFVASYFVFFATLNVFHQIVNGLQRIPAILPLVLSAVLSLFIFYTSVFINIYPETSHWQRKRLAIYGIMIACMGLVVLISSFALLGYFGGVENVITDFYPIDLLLFGILSLLLGVVYIVLFLSERKRKENIILSRSLTRKAKIGFVLFTLLATYFTGVLGIGIVCTGYTSWVRDGLGVMITFILFALPAIGLLLYALIRAFKKTDCLKAGWIAAGIYTGLSAVIMIVSLIYSASKPIFYASELHFMFPVGFAIKTHVGVYLLFAISMFGGVISLVNLAVQQAKRKG